MSSPFSIISHRWYTKGHSLSSFLSLTFFCSTTTTLPWLGLQSCLISSGWRGINPLPNLKTRRLFNANEAFQAFKREEIANKFHNVTEQIEVALCEIPYKKLAISDEVREQIELVHSQFRRAKERT